MDHHRAIDAVKGAAANHVFLPRMALFGWGPQHDDAPRGHRHHPLQRRSEREERTHARGRNDVVAARMTDARQGVVLGEDSDGGVLTFVEIETLPGRFKGGLHAVGTTRDSEAAFFDNVREQGGAAVFLEGGLRMCVKIRHDVVEGVREVLHALFDEIPRCSGCGGGDGGLNDALDIALELAMHRVEVRRRRHSGMFFR